MFFAKIVLSLKLCCHPCCALHRCSTTPLVEFAHNFESFFVFFEVFCQANSFLSLAPAHIICNATRIKEGRRRVGEKISWFFETLPRENFKIFEVSLAQEVSKV